MKLLFSHTSFIFIFVFFSVDQLNWLMSLGELGSSVQRLVSLLVFANALYQARGTTHVVLPIGTLKNVYCRTHLYCFTLSLSKGYDDEQL